MSNQIKDASVLSFSPRPELGRFQPYQPGLAIEDIRRRYHLKRVIKLASNENPLGPSPKALAALKAAMPNVHRYPESQSRDLRERVAHAFKVKEESVIIGAGSDEIIELLAKAFLSAFHEIIVSASSFIQYQFAGHLMGARVIVVPMNQMKHDLKSMASLVTERTKFIFVANPNNPTGTYNTRAEVERFLQDLPSHVVPVFDEAYFEYASVKEDYPSMIEEFFKKRPLVVLRTFSKIFGLAGLRVGYGMAPDWCVAAMDKIRPPFNVSVMAQVAAGAALNDQAHVKRSVKMNEQQKSFLASRLQELGIRVVPSAANFLLFQAPRGSGRALFEALLKKGLIARAVDEYGLKDYLRVTVGQADENRAFLKALREVLKSQ